VVVCAAQMVPVVRAMARDLRQHDASEQSS